MSQQTYVAPAIQSSGSAFADLTAGGLANVLNKLITANPAQTNPTTAASVSVTGGGSTGGNLPAGTYKVAYTWCDGAGETTIGTTEASFTSAAGNIPRVTIPALPSGAAFANVYLSVAGGASGSEVLYGQGVTGTTFDLSYAAPLYPGTTVPATNTTGAVMKANYLHLGTSGILENLWLRASRLVTQFAQGDPVDYQEFYKALSHLDYAFHAFAQCTKEILTLAAANPGSLHNAANFTTGKTYRTFP